MLHWLGFYVLLHLLLCVIAWPLLWWLRQQQRWSAALMLKVWYSVAVVLLVLPIVMLQPWALQSQLLPWFQSSMQQLSYPDLPRQQPPIHNLYMDIAADERIKPELAPLFNPVQNTALAPSSAQASEQVSALAVVDTQVRWVQWPLMAELLHKWAPPSWFWWILPLVSIAKLAMLWRSYRQTQQLRRQSQQVRLLASETVCPDSRVDTAALSELSLSEHRVPELIVAERTLSELTLPVRCHPQLDSAMLVGWRQAEILLPTAYLQQFDASQMAHILTHEVCHHHYGDLRHFTLQRILLCGLWWSPAVRFCAAQLNRWREVRCDQTISQRLAQPHLYAQTLLDCARWAQQQRVSSRSWFAVHWWQSAEKSAGSTAASGRTFIAKVVNVARCWQASPLLALRIEHILQPVPRRDGLWSSLCALSLLCVVSMALSKQWQLADVTATHAQHAVADLALLSPLLSAVADHNLTQVTQLLAQGAPVNLASPGDGTALMVAVRHQHSALVRILLAAGADPNVSSRGDGNALIIAAQRGDLALAAQLLAAGADVNAAVLGDETALINASRRGDRAMIDLLLQHGAAINLQVQTPLSDGRVWRSALNQAASAELRHYLLQRGAR
jgi:hypothetical protein